METFVFFDLEETLIDEWNSFSLINIPKIQKLLKTFPSKTTFGLFSYAVHNQRDMDKFLSEKEFIENNFGFLFDKDFLYTVEELNGIFSKLSKTKSTISDFFDFYKKENAFLLFSKLEIFHNSHIILVDDMVRDCEMFFPKTNTKVTLINVLDLN